STAGTGDGGTVQVVALGPLSLSDPRSGIVALATPTASGNAGSVTVSAGTLTVEGGAQIASTTAGPGKGGEIDVTVANGVTLSGTGPNGASGISAAALPGSSGSAGPVVLKAGGAIWLSGGAQVTSSTEGTGNGG